MSNQENPRPKRPMDDPTQRKNGLFTIVMVGLFTTFIITATHPNFVEHGTVIFMAIMGGVVFATFLMFAREVKQFKKKLQS